MHDLLFLLALPWITTHAHPPSASRTAVMRSQLPDFPMHILLLADSYLPSTKSSAKLLFDLSVELNRQGHEVFVAVPDDTLAAARQVTREPQATVLRVRSARLKTAWKPLRAWRETRLSSLLWKQGSDFFRQHRCDLIAFYSPSIFFAPLVERLKTLWNCPAYLILRDIFPQWAVDTGVLRKGLVYRYFRKHELAQYAIADAIGVQSPANLDYFRANGWGDRYALEVLYNWCNLEEAPAPVTNLADMCVNPDRRLTPPARQSYRRQWGLADKLVFFYGGNIGVAQDFDNLLRLAARVREEQKISEPKIHFLLVGDGSEVGWLQTRIQARNLTNVTWRPAVSQQEYPGLVSEVDVGLISLDRRLNTQNLPGKMLGYMAARLPILASINPGNDLKQVLEEGDAGLTFLNGDDAGLCAGALRLARSPELRRRMGQNGRRLLESKFSVETAARQIVQHARGAPTLERQAA